MGIGLIMHIVAKMAFVLVGYSIHMYLGKSLDAAIYGSIGVIMSIININYNFLSNGARQAASHLIAAGKFNEKDLIRKSYFYQMLIAVVLAIINFVGADFIANVLQQPDLDTYIRVTAFMIPFTALYFISVGIMNGYKLLVFEALTVTIYPLMRLSIIPLVEFVCEDAVLGTVYGFFIAAIIGCLVGNLFLAKNIKFVEVKASYISSGEYVKQIINFLSFFLCVTIILNLDMLFVNALVVEGEQVGYYTGATNLSKVTYYLLSAIYLVALPVVTSAYSNRDFEKCKETINGLLMLICGLILPIVAIAGPLCGNLMVVFYKEEYRSAEFATGLLMVSQFLLGLFVIYNVLICSTKNKKYSVVLGIIMVLLDSVLCLILVPRYSINGAAIASLLTNCIGAFVSGCKTKKIFGSIGGSNIIKLIIANVILCIIMIVLSRFWISDNFWVTMFVCALSYLCFCAFLIGTKLLPMKVIKGVLKKNKK